MLKVAYAALTASAMFAPARLVARSHWQVTLVAQTDLPRGAATAVQLRAHLLPKDVLLVDLSRAKASDLAAALDILSALHRRYGESPPRDILAAPGRYVPGRRSHAFELATFEAYLHALSWSKATTVEGFGKVRAIKIDVSPGDP